MSIYALKVGDLIEWWIGPRKLRREGVVIELLTEGRVRVRTEAKTNPIRTVLPECGPRRVFARALNLESNGRSHIGVGTGPKIKTPASPPEERPQILQVLLDAFEYVPEECADGTYVHATSSGGDVRLSISVRRLRELSAAVDRLLELEQCVDEATRRSTSVGDEFSGSCSVNLSVRDVRRLWTALRELRRQS